MLTVPTPEQLQFAKFLIICGLSTANFILLTFIFLDMTRNSQGRSL